MKSLMVRLWLLTALIAILPCITYSQSGIPTYQFGSCASFNQSIINLPCGQTCFDIKLQAPHIKQTSDYLVSSTCYNPFPYVTATGSEDPNIYNDDRYSSVVNLTFPFCFYDSIFNSMVVGSNGLISFELGNANCSNAAYNIIFPLPHNSGLNTPPCTSNSGSYPKASIMAVFQDLDPRPGPSSGINSSPADRKIEWRVEGTAPSRRYVISYYHIGVYQSTVCGQDPNQAANFQIILHEGTGIVDVLIGRKLCTPVTESSAILGIHDWTRTRWQTAPGKNAAVWSA